MPVGRSLQEPPRRDFNLRLGKRRPSGLDRHDPVQASAQPDQRHQVEAAVRRQCPGDRHAVVESLRRVCGDYAVRELAALSDLLDASPFADRVTFDFSVVNDMSYYNGFVFRGFLGGVSEGVLAGGQYDNMMTRLKRKSKAVGFALYVSMLEDLLFESSEYDVDVALLYDEDADLSALCDAANALRADGQTVLVETALPKAIRAKRVMKFKGKGIIEDA